MDGFLWGVATAAYQVEGGLNGDGQPQNNWAPWDRSGRVERCGAALRFWGRPEELLDRARHMGCNAFRLSVEWARVQPSARRHETIEPDWDAAALDRYADILAACRSRGMEPVVTLLHFTHPLWCGEDFWLRDDAPERFERYVRRCVRELGRRLSDRGEAPVRWWITINEPVVVPLMTYLLGMFPGGKPGLGRFRRSHELTLAAHVHGYDAVHDTYEQEGWGAPLVSTNTISFTTVDFDALEVDLLLAREKGLDPGDLPAYLRACRERARRRVAGVRRRDVLSAVADRAAHEAARLTSLRPDGPAARALWRSPRARKLDYLSLDVYDPVVGHFLGPGRPGARRHRARPWIAELWEQEHSPDALAVFLRAQHLQAPDRPILLAENGMSTPGHDPRPDGLTRDVFVRRMGAEVRRAREEGIPVAGSIHWTVADNYEWGSYKPRFGLHGVRRRGDEVEIMDTDATGVDAAAAYRELIG